ncbi:MAG: hypothetical protein O3A01_04835 [bacterium]|nr:hypothetical protein [bacterium]
MLTKKSPKLPVYGIYLGTPTRKKPLSRVDYTFIPIDYIAHWSRCGITADYLAEYQAFNFEKRDRVKNILSTIINELLENAVKFSADAYKEISISIYNYADTISIQTINSTYRRQAEHFDGYVQKLLDEDPEELFIENIMKNAENEKSASQLGLITLVKDFNAKIGAKIIPDLERRLYDIYFKVVIDTNAIEEL